jgi:hypothetical protein
VPVSNNDRQNSLLKNSASYQDIALAKRRFVSGHRVSDAVIRVRHCFSDTVLRIRVSL